MWPHFHFVNFPFFLFGFGFSISVDICSSYCAYYSTVAFKARGLCCVSALTPCNCPRRWLDLILEATGSCIGLHSELILLQLLEIIASCCLLLSWVLFARLFCRQLHQHRHHCYSSLSLSLLWRCCRLSTHEKRVSAWKAVAGCSTSTST